MSADYKPGTVAVVTFQTDDMLNPNTQRGIRWQRGWSVVYDDGAWELIHDRAVSDVRPLVVLDPDDREQVERLMRVVRDNAFESGDSYPGMGRFADAMQAALRSQIKPPKPAEPQGRYAVVVDIGGDEWVRDGLDSDLAHDGPWWNATQARECAGTQTRRADYADIDVVRVLSEGVQP